MGFVEFIHITHWFRLYSCIIINLSTAAQYRSSSYVLLEANVAVRSGFSQTCGWPASRCCPGQQYRTFRSFSHSASSESQQRSLVRLQPALHRQQQRLSSTWLLPGVGTRAAFLPAVPLSSARSEQVKTDQRNWAKYCRSPVFVFAVKYWLYFLFIKTVLSECDAAREGFPDPVSYLFTSN